MIYLGADHRGYELKEKVKSWLSDWGHEYEDCGAFEYNKDDDYPDFATAVAEKVALRQAQDQNARGILICGSGIGVAIAANKIKGIRAGTAASEEQVKASVNDEDLNILALSADYINENEAQEIVKTFLETKFSGADRHIRRVNKIRELEK
ncbi:MAG: RpiB/LacA/LacB family sugar-phosphate isomerase [Candidatus Yanofskybacteria bacterium]|nr:RpiB/LacA/LacB family sugar-phosphate isomerase [Candidatus Yanofskybacteria bacterium]